MPEPPPSDDEDEEWPDPPYPGFIPLDDRMENRKHSRRWAEIMWAEIQERLRKGKRETDS